MMSKETMELASVIASAHDSLLYPKPCEVIRCYNCPIGDSKQNCKLFKIIKHMSTVISEIRNHEEDTCQECSRRNTP